MQDLKKGGASQGGRHDLYKKGDGLGAGMNIQTSSGQPVGQIEVGEVVINRQATAANCEQLSAINQSAGGGIAIDCEATRQTIANTQLPSEVINAPQMENGAIVGQPTVVVESIWDILFWSIEKPFY